MTPRRVVGAALLCGALSPAIYIAADVTAAARYPGYSATDQAVSELFAIGAPTSGLVVTLFSLSSGLLLAFAGGIWWSAGGDRRLRRLAVVFAAGALEALVLWNLFPMHMRGAAQTATDAAHLLLAANPFVPLAMIVAAGTVRRWFRAYTIGTLVVLLALAAFAFSYAPALAANGPTPGMGLGERIGQYGYGVWEVVLAGVLWRDSEAVNRRQRLDFWRWSSF
jgi:uncharacterized protein DUF998